MTQSTQPRRPSHESSEDQAEPSHYLLGIPAKRVEARLVDEAIPEVEPMSEALRKAAMNMVNAASRDWPSSPVTRAAVIGASAALREALDGLVQQEQAGFTVSLDFLKRVQESLSDYCGELDWGNADMELMDEVEAMLAAAPKGEKP